MVQTKKKSPREADNAEDARLMADLGKMEGEVMRLAACEQRELAKEHLKAARILLNEARRYAAEATKAKV